MIHFVDSLTNGGAENILCHSINALDKFHNILVYLFPPHDLRSLVKADEVIFLNCKGKAGFPFVIFLINKLLRSRRAIAIHTHSYWTNIIGRLAAFGGVKVFNSYHFADYDTMSGNKSVQRMIMLDNLTFNKKVKRIAVSEYVRSILSRKLKMGYSTIVIPNFIGNEYIDNRDCRIYQPKSKLRVITVGNIKKEKNYDLIVQACRNLIDIDLQIDIYGGGAQLDTYIKKAQEYNLNNLTFQGPAKNVHELLPDYHLYLMSSFSEACPLSPIQIIPCGMPALLSKIPSLIEIFNDEAIYFQSNNKNDLVEKLKSIYNGETSIEVNRTRYQEIIEKYKLENYVNKLESLYLL